MTIMPGMGPNMGQGGASWGTPEGGWFKMLQQASPLLMAMGQNMATPPQMRDPAAMQRGMAGVMQMQQQRAAEEQRAKQQEAIQRVLQSGQVPQGLAGVLGAMEPGQAAGTLAQVMMGAEPTEFERLTRGLDPDAARRAQMIKLGLEPDADTTLRVGAMQTGRDPIAALRARAQEAGIQPGTPEYAQFMMAGGAQSGLAVDVDPATGQVSVRQGAGAAQTQRPFTEGQSKDVVYATRARGALEAFEPIAGAMTSFADRALNMDPTGALRGNFQSDEFQVAQNAGNEFLQAILRKDTGAAITADEQALYGQTYLPQPGDNPQVIEEKARARQRAIAAIEAGMSPAQMIAQERGLRAAGSQGRAAPPPGIDPEDWEFLSPEERLLFGGSGDENPSQPAAAGLVDKISFVESGNNPTARNPRSTATGAGQFIESTWLSMIQRHRPELADLPRDTLLELRNDPEISRDMIARYAMDNARGLQSAGLPVNKGTLYLAHFAGLGGAQSVLTAPPSASVAEVLGRKVIDANPFLSGKTVEWLRNWAMRKMGVSA